MAAAQTEECHDAYMAPLPFAQPTRARCGDRPDPILRWHNYIEESTPQSSSSSSSSSSPAVPNRNYHIQSFHYFCAFPYLHNKSCILLFASSAAHFMRHLRDQHSHLIYFGCRRADLCVIYSVSK